jgi:hypothetical protein
MGNVKNKSLNYYEKMEAMVVMDEEWPWFKNPNLFSELQEIANTSFQKKNIEGYLSSVLIYQQLVEEMLWVLLKDCQFLIKISLWGRSEIHFKEQKGVMFGRLIDEIKNTIEFKSKSDIVGKCNQLNRIRIEVVHGLVKNGIHMNISEKAASVKNYFEEILNLFTEAHNEFLTEFEKEKEDLIINKQYELYG